MASAWVCGPGGQREGSLSVGAAEKTRSLWLRGLRSAGPLPWLVLAASLALTYTAWRSERRGSERELQADFEYRVRGVGSRIEQRMQAYEQVLRGAAGLFASSEYASRGGVGPTSPRSGWRSTTEASRPSVTSSSFPQRKESATSPRSAGRGSPNTTFTPKA